MTGLEAEFNSPDTSPIAASHVQCRVGVIMELVRALTRFSVMRN
jgi:hypothetical protein